MADVPHKHEHKKERSITPLLRDAAPLIMLASALFYTNRWLSLTADETSHISAAAQNVTTILRAGSSAAGNAYPPIYQLLLHAWLRITGGAFDWLRGLTIISFLVGLWFLSRVARSLGGEESGNALVWLGTLWPFGFHAGRLAAPYSFAFLLIAAITWQYFRCRESRRGADWIVFCALALALLYTTDFGWAFLVLFGIDYSWRSPKTDARENTRMRTKRHLEILATAAVLIAGFAPRWPVLIREIHSNWALPRFARFFFLNAAYHFYVLFVSQSVAPWFWRFSIPAALGVAVLLVLSFVGIRGGARRFFIYSVLLFGLIAFTGTLQTERLLLLGPWLLLPMAIALGTIERLQWRIPMAIAVAAIAAIGWYGVLNRRYYATPEFFEPWSTVAQDAAEAVRNGSAIISNDNSFFFYLTYAIKPGEKVSSWHFSGALPKNVQYPSVFDPQQWEQAGRPKPATLVWVRGSSPPDELATMNAAGDWLSVQCGDRITRYLARDPAYTWKQRYVPNFSGPAWRIEIRQYFCGSLVPPPSAGISPAPKVR
jgi:hypothetical protein